MNDDEWADFWLDHELWDAPDDTPADQQRTINAWWQPNQTTPQQRHELVRQYMASQTNVNAPQYPTVHGLRTDTPSHAMVTEDGQIGLWIKLDRAAWDRWQEMGRALECLPAESDLWDDDDWEFYVWAHNRALHTLADYWANWFSKAELLAEQFGWE